MSVIEACLAFYRGQPEVVGVSLCGSARQGNLDALSDLDLWVFLTNEADISEQIVVERYLPRFAQQEQLKEGRDDTLLPYITINAATRDGVLNLKFLQMKVFSQFVVRPATLEETYLEDLENYYTMKVLYDPQSTLGLHQRMLEHTALHGVSEELVPEIINRYSSLFWRSFYQGVYRSERRAWKSLMHRMTELLCFVTFLKEDRLPPPRKWLYSDFILDSVKDGVLFKDILDKIDGVDVQDKTAVLDFYVNYIKLEAEILNHEYLHYNFWWHGVFLKRPENVAIAEGLRHAIEGKLIRRHSKGVVHVDLPI